MPPSSQCAASARFLVSAAPKDGACREPRDVSLGWNAPAPAGEPGLPVAAPPWVRSGGEMLGGEGALPGTRQEALRDAAHRVLRSGSAPACRRQRGASAVLKKDGRRGKAFAGRETEAAIMHDKALLRDSPLLCCGVERRAVEG